MPCLVAQLCGLLLQPTRLLCPWNSPGKNTGVGCHFLLQGIFLTQESNPGLLHSRKILYHLSYREVPIFFYYTGFPGGSDSIESSCNAGDPGSILGSERSPGEGNGNPLQYSCLENSMDRGAWWAPVHGLTKSRTQLKQLNTHTSNTDSYFISNCYRNLQLEWSRIQTTFFMICKRACFLRRTFQVYTPSDFTYQSIHLTNTY